MKNIDVCKQWIQNCIDNKSDFVKSRNMSACCDYLKSYRTIICKYIHGVFVLSSVKYSITTSKHTTMLIGQISICTHRNQRIRLLVVDNVNNIQCINRDEFIDNVKNKRYLFDIDTKVYNEMEL